MNKVNRVAASALVSSTTLKPGWEHVLSKRSMLAAYGALALGLAAGALLDRNWIGKK
jgi:hypothetical protein